MAFAFDPVVTDLSGADNGADCSPTQPRSAWLSDRLPELHKSPEHRTLSNFSDDTGTLRTVGSDLESLAESFSSRLLGLGSPQSQNTVNSLCVFVNRALFPRSSLLNRMGSSAVPLLVAILVDGSRSTKRESISGRQAGPGGLISFNAAPPLVFPMPVCQQGDPILHIMVVLRGCPDASPVADVVLGKQTITLHGVKDKLGETLKQYELLESSRCSSSLTATNLAGRPVSNSTVRSSRSGQASVRSAADLSSISLRESAIPGLPPLAVESRVDSRGASADASAVSLPRRGPDEGPDAVSLPRRGPDEGPPGEESATGTAASPKRYEDTDAVSQVSASDTVSPSGLTKTNRNIDLNGERLMDSPPSTASDGLRLASLRSHIGNLPQPPSAPESRNTSANTHPSLEMTRSSKDNYSWNYDHEILGAEFDVEVLSRAAPSSPWHPVGTVHLTVRLVASEAGLKQLSMWRIGSAPETSGASRSPFMTPVKVQSSSSSNSNVLSSLLSMDRPLPPQSPVDSPVKPLS